MSEVTHCKGLLPVRHPHQRGKKLDSLLLETLHMEQQCRQLNSIYLLLPFLLSFLRSNLMTVFLFPETSFLLVAQLPTYLAVEKFYKMEAVYEITGHQRSVSFIEQLYTFFGLDLINSED